MGTNALPAAIEDELELELIQSHMAQKPVLRGEDDLSRGGMHSAAIYNNISH